MNGWPNQKDLALFRGEVRNQTDQNSSAQREGAEVGVIRKMGA